MSSNKRFLKISFLTLILTMGLGFTVFPIKGQERPKLFVDPKDNVFSTETTVVGDTFTVDIATSGWELPGLYGYEFKLYYDPTLLNITSAEYPDGHFLDWTGNFPTPVIIDYEAGTALFGGILLGDVPGSTGSGVFATVTLQIITAPPTAKSVSCDLRINDIAFLDPDGIGIEDYDVEHGYYEFAAPKPPLPYLKVLPETARADVIGEQVLIDITIQELEAVWKAVALEWKLTYDPTVLGFINATEGDFLAQFADPETGGTFFAHVQEEDYVISFSLLFADPWPPTVFPEGSGTLATLIFEATNAGSCDLTLSDVAIVDVDGNFIETRAHESGVYAFAPPWLSVSPGEVTLESIGETFSLHVVMNELDKTWKMVGVEFKLHYNTTLLETSEDAILEGDFLKDFAQQAGTDTWFQAYVEEEHGLIGILILPLINGTWPEDVFPEGTGVLASLTFTAIWQHETDDVTDYLNVYDILLVDVEVKTIPVDSEKTALEGTCTYTILKAYKPPPVPPPERLVDLFTQYDAPYGGQGIGVASDAFAPQGQVKLFAKVTYRGESVPGKPVAYQIRGPNGYEFLETTFSGGDGAAVLDFSIPASEAYFGVWDVTASVDIAGQVVTDVVFFRVGWLMSVKEIMVESTDGTIIENDKEYQLLLKGRTYPISSTLKVITMQPPTQCVQLQDLEPKTLLVYSGYDELKQPLFSQYIPVSIGYFMTLPTVDDINSFVLDPAGRQLDGPRTSITIPTSAYSGVANINGNIFTDFPWFSGVPYSSTTRKQVWILASPLGPPPPAPPAPTAVLSVSSARVSEGKTFFIDVNIKDLDPDAHIVAIEFRVKYEDSLLEALEVVEGDFVKQFGDTFLMWYIEDGVIVGELQLPPWPGENGWMRGSGTVVRIKFQALAYGSCFLTPTEAVMLDVDGNYVDFKRLEYGLVIVA